MIGNGFDLNLGVESKFEQFYVYYIGQPSKNDVVKNFKTLLKANLKTWADFEMSIPDIYEKIGNFDKFKESFLDFKQELTCYLKKQESTFSLKADIGKYSSEFREYTIRFQNYLSHTDKENSKNKIKQIERVTCLTFNYTNFVDELVSEIKKEDAEYRKSPYNNDKRALFNIKHIHSDLTDEIILGLDNDEQYKDLAVTKRDKLDYLFNKATINKMKSNIESECLAEINKSNLIGIYGWSFGDSDTRWVEYIKNKLKKDPKTQIVYSPYYADKWSSLVDSDKFHRVDESKNMIIEKFELDSSYLENIYIINKDEYMKISLAQKLATV